MQLLDYIEAKKLIGRYGIGSIDSRYVNNANEAVVFAGGKRIVLKVLSAKALHKSKAGLVKMDLGDESEIRSAYKELEEKGRQYAPFKIIAQKMAKKGVEIIVGGRTDEQFGKLILLGLGGIYVEVFKDIALRVCPITKYDAEEMLNQLKSREIITYNSACKPMLVKLLMDVSELLTKESNINELDLNPVIVREDGYDVVDIRILK